MLRRTVQIGVAACVVAQADLKKILTLRQESVSVEMGQMD